jgi:hypothetical protein
MIFVKQRLDKMLKVGSKNKERFLMDSLSQPLQLDRHENHFTSAHRFD